MYPGIVNTFIGLFKDTTLVSIVGIFDLLVLDKVRSQMPLGHRGSTVSMYICGIAFLHLLFWYVPVFNIYGKTG